MKFYSTRNKKAEVSGAEAVCRGISDEGGLFVPQSFPEFSSEQIKAFCGEPYENVAAQVIGEFLPELKNELPEYTRAAYSRFDGDPAPLVKVFDKTYVLELWHGPTHAFKDIALTLLPYLLQGSKKLLGNLSTTLIPVATSGDTGKAALEGFSGVGGTAVAVFYPDGGVSELQRLQMITTEGDNVFVSAIKGNFDDAQTAVKKAFTDTELKSALAKLKIELSSANSINFGRLAPQITYYFTAYADLAEGKQIRFGDKVDFCVPSGNFGDILAGYYALKMGLPVGRLICASNINNVLADFISTGTYDARREFRKTSSPSMDILVSSNLERLVFDLSGENDELTASRMAKLKEEGVYSLTPHEAEAMRRVFAAGYASEEEVADTVAEYFDEYGYIIDPHTAVAAAVAAKTRDGKTPLVILSTASPHKFAASVLKAIEERPTGNELKDLQKLEEVTALEVPESLINLPTKEKIFTDCIELGDVNGTIIAFAERLGKK